MGIYSYTYKNLRRNWFRNFSTVLRIAFGVILLLILLGSGLGINTVLGQNQGGNNTDQNDDSMILNIVNNLNQYLNSTLGTEITNSPLYQGIRLILRNIITIIDILASIVFLIGIFGITYAMDLNLLERKQEIGLLKSMGFTEIQIMISYLLEAGLLGFIGALVGTIIVIIGLGVVSYVIQLELFSIVMPPSLPLGAIILTTILSSALAIISVWFNVKKDPVEALRI